MLQWSLNSGNDSYGQVLLVFKSMCLCEYVPVKQFFHLWSCCMFLKKNFYIKTMRFWTLGKEIKNDRWTWQNIMERWHQLLKVGKHWSVLCFHQHSAVPIRMLLCKAQKILVWEKHLHSEVFRLCDTHSLGPISCPYANAFNSSWTRWLFQQKKCLKLPLFLTMVTLKLNLNYIFKYSSSKPSYLRRKPST